VGRTAKIGVHNRAVECCLKPRSQFAEEQNKMPRVVEGGTVYVNRRARKVAHFPEFSIRILRGAHEMMSVVYQEDARTLTFEGELVAPDWKQINLLIPADFPAEDLTRVVKNLEKGIAELGYEYRILRHGAIEAVPEEDRQRALAELRAMGWDPQVSADGAAVEMKRSEGAAALPDEIGGEQSMRVAALVMALHGKRHKLDELARSKSAQG
jgi:hypothetical protein